MKKLDTRPYAHFWAERSYGYYSLKEQLEMVQEENRRLKKEINNEPDILIEFLRDVIRVACWGVTVWEKKLVILLTKVIDEIMDLRKEELK